MANSDENAMWSIFGYLLSGLIFWGGIGYGLDTWLDKGIFTLITIGSGLLAMWFFQRRWHEMGRAKWWLALLLTLLFTGPELLALYLQFDAQAQKQVFGQTQVSGIRFFLWDSQFGRFFNTGPIRNTDGNPVFFLHVFLWAFLRWTGVAFAAVVRAWREFGASPAAQRTALVYLAASFFVTFLLFSLTSFQLDYYAVILFPFAAVVCGQFLDQLLKDSGHHRPLYATQIVLSVLLLAMALGMALYTDKAVVLGALLLMLVLGLAGAQQHLVGNGLQLGGRSGLGPGGWGGVRRQAGIATLLAEGVELLVRLQVHLAVVADRKASCRERV